MASASDKKEIKCIFFSEFHPTAGPRITYQIPEDYMSKEVFDSLSVYIIPKVELQKKVITVTALNHKLLGYPVSIDNPKYDRNALIFNLVFVCDAGSRTVQYEPVVKKISGYLVTLELECGFISNEATRVQLPSIMKQILEDLNLCSHCTIPINPSNTMHLRVVRVYQDPPHVLDHQVPLFILPKSSFLSAHWDLTTQQILPYMDGFNHVMKIAAEADVEISLVKACIQNMVYYGIVTLIPIFQYSNVYTVTPTVQKLASNKSLQEECFKYVARNERKIPSLRDLFTLYCGMCPGTTVRDLCVRHNPGSMQVDERKLIQFGLMKGLIRRLHKYPVLVTESPLASNNQALYKYFTGVYSYDEICCKTGLNYQELDNKIEFDSNILVCWK